MKEVTELSPFSFVVEVSSEARGIEVEIFRLWFESARS